MKKAVWFAAIILLPGIAVAAENVKQEVKQQASDAGEGFKRIDANKDGGVSLEEAKKAGAAFLVNNFSAIDANKSGKLSPEEIRAFIQKRREQEVAQIKQENKDNFARIDANHDGSISMEEAEKAPAPLLANNFAAIDANKDAKLTLEEISIFMQVQREQDVLRMRKAEEENFRRIDANKDGGISLEEANKARAMLLANNFTAIDVNKDGKLTQQEINSFVQGQRAATGRLRAADKDGNGTLSRDEAKALPRLFADFDNIDANHDGQISPPEISAYYASGKAPAAATTKSSK